MTTIPGGRERFRRARRSAVAIGAATAGICLSVLGMPSPAGADVDLMGYGWWYLPNQAPNNVVGPPAPPWVPSDGMYVAGESSGAIAMAAVRYTGEGPGSLTLELTEDGQGGPPSVSACVALSTWDGVSSGRWEGRPAFDCGNNALGEVSEDGQTMVFTLTPTLQRVPGVYDLALVPTGVVPFSATFNAPSAASLVVTGDSGEVEDPTTAAADPDGFSNSGSSGAGDFGEFETTFPAFDGSRTATVPPVTSPAPVLQPGRPDVLGTTPGNRLALPDDRNQRMAAVAGLAALLLGAWLFGGRTVRPPRLLGSVAGRSEVAPAETAQETPERGVGPFARRR